MTKRKKRFLLITGFLYGLTLTFIGLLATGAGHGTYVLSGIFSSPFGLLGILPGLFGGIILWPVTGTLLENVSSAPGKKLFLYTMATHYCGAILLLNTETFGDWDYFPRSFSNNPVFISLGFVFYIIGQITIWFFFISSNRKTETLSLT